MSPASGGEEGRLIMATGEVCCHWFPGSGRILLLGTFSPLGGRGGVAHHGPWGLTLHFLVHACTERLLRSHKMREVHPIINVDMHP